MATATRDVKEDVASWAARLAEAPGEVDFFTALDLLARFTGGAPLGADGRFQDERVRLGHRPDLGFAPAELAAVALEHAPQGPRAEVSSSFFGLTGAVTPLPLHFAEEADRDDAHGEAVRGVLGLFHHRLLSLLYRSSRELDYPSNFRADARDPWSRRVLALLGAPERPRTLSPAQMLRLAPVLATGVRSPQMLEAALRISLEDCLGDARVRCDPFTGEWMPIDAAEWSLLGAETATVGVSAVLGTSVLHRSGAARITIGPLGGDNYKQFTAGGQAHGRVLDLLDVFLDQPLHLEMVLEIQDMSYPPALLGERRLGEDLWLARSRTSGLTTRIAVPLAGKGAPR